jgi:hypothetical protein
MRSTRRRTPGFLLLLVAATAVASAIGCNSGPPRGEVRGKVTFKGQPVTEGSITFLSPAGKGDGGAEIGRDGSYEIKGGLAVGDFIVIINPPIHMVDTSPGKTPPSPEEKPAPNIPPRYRNQGLSPLRASVKAGPNTFDFDMTR